MRLGITRGVTGASLWCQNLGIATELTQRVSNSVSHLQIYSLVYRSLLKHFVGNLKTVSLPFPREVKECESVNRKT